MATASPEPSKAPAHRDAGAYCHGAIVYFKYVIVAKNGGSNTSS